MASKSVLSLVVAGALALPAAVFAADSDSDRSADRPSASSRERGPAVTTERDNPRVSPGVSTPSTESRPSASMQGLGKEAPADGAIVKGPTVREQGVISSEGSISSEPFSSGGSSSDRTPGGLTRE